ncbi:hypothetical protein THICB3470098 [Thiomonas sp. CB3]|nr:hypothetical protein THICB3470098 [Thiomonas sp. CB3]
MDHRLLGLGKRSLHMEPGLLARATAWLPLGAASLGAARRRLAWPGRPLGTALILQGMRTRDAARG